LVDQDSSSAKPVTSLVPALDMSFEAKRFRHVAVAISRVRVRLGIAVSPRHPPRHRQTQPFAGGEEHRCPEPNICADA
jgi:hypothetical protein